MKDEAASLEKKTDEKCTLYYQKIGKKERVINTSCAVLVIKYFCLSYDMPFCFGFGFFLFSPE